MIVNFYSPSHYSSDLSLQCVVTLIPCGERSNEQEV
jgi:hypothetical protein